MTAADWQDLGEIATLEPLSEVIIGKTRLAVSFVNGELSVISGACSHVGGPLGKGTLEGEYVVCPWHQWKWHRATGARDAGVPGDAVPSYTTKIENGHAYVDMASATARTRLPREPHPLARTPVRPPGPLRVVGISTTVMDRAYPRPSTSERLLQIALDEAAANLKCETRLIALDRLKFEHCEGFYSKSARACTWPCSITQMNPEDEMDQVYEAFVHWADIIVVATPIRWGNASSLYYKMVERCNCIQNQETIASKVLLKNKVAAFIVTGGQDNVQGVVGQMLTFFAEIGCQFPQHPFIAHSRGWSAEDMENNIKYVEESTELADGARGLVKRCVDMARLFQSPDHTELELVAGGRKAHRLQLITDAPKRE